METVEDGSHGVRTAQPFTGVPVFCSRFPRRTTLSAGAWVGGVVEGTRKGGRVGVGVGPPREVTERTQIESPTARPRLVTHSL